MKYPIQYLPTIPGITLEYQTTYPKNGQSPKRSPLMSDLEIVQTPEPIIAWKEINVNYHRPYWEIQTRMGVNHPNGILATKGIALCGAVGNTNPDRDYNSESREHSPEEFATCSCGFYGLKSHKSIGDNQGWLAKVRFYGIVIECERGYRATKQDILEVWAPNEYSEQYSKTLEKLPEQFPSVKWHLPDLYAVQPYSPKDMAQEVTHIHLDPLYDILPKEVIDQLMPNQYYQYQLPFYKNQAMGMVARFTTNNNGITLELSDYNGARLLGPILFSGSRYHWYGPDGKPLNGR